MNFLELLWKTSKGVNMATFALLHTSTLVDGLMRNYIQHLSTHSLTLSAAHCELISGFLTALVAAYGITQVSRETIIPIGSLLSTSIPRSFHVGTGHTVSQNICSAIASAQHEVLFVTCFWSPSTSLNLLSSALMKLNNSKRKMRVRIGFSSSSAPQKLFHTSSARGKTYPPSSWCSLGLPAPEKLTNLDLVIKSIFYLPFSVLHGKFVIVDRHVLFLPSANISWERWLEQCIEFSGEIVDAFLQFWDVIWAVDGSTTNDVSFPLLTAGNPPQKRSEGEEEQEVNILFPTETKYPTIFLPQPHHRNPSFTPLSLCTSPRIQSFPLTPQNTFFLHLISSARNSVFIFSPNFTSTPFLNALSCAVTRNVSVTIVTSRNMMVVEQLITTGLTATTERCLGRLVKQHSPRAPLHILYYPAGEAEIVDGESTEGAVKTHVKAMVVDDEITVLGSANCDRASWWTSQEVNVAVFSTEFAETVTTSLRAATRGRLEHFCDETNLV
jgi:phosphatidylserine/phosphatidylglycerophosphate/cardiolipin synthase-like enzyme